MWRLAHWASTSQTVRETLCICFSPRANDTDKLHEWFDVRPATGAVDVYLIQRRKVVVELEPTEPLR